ncbi:MAG: hypothetical protein RLZZ505_2705 [Verrucomicrobiota bacterium]|jgi:hypothetical protein
MKTKQRYLLAALAPAAIFGLASQTSAATLLTTTFTEARYNFDDPSGPTANPSAAYVDFTTDSSGNGRIMSTISAPPSSGGEGWDPIAPGSTKSLFNWNGAYATGMTNTTGMATDDFQISIYASSFTSDKSAMTILTVGPSLILGISGNGGGNLGSFYAEVDGTTIGTSAVEGNYDSQGLMIQRSGGVYSFWVDTAANGTWTQVGSDVTSAVVPDWSTTSLLATSSGTQKYNGFIDDFVVASVPEPRTALLGCLGLLALLRRRRS